MKNKKSINLYYSILIFISLSVIGLIFEIIYYEYLKLIFPNDITFFGLPFNLPTFMFGLTFILMISILAIILFYFPKNKKRINKIKEKKKIL